MKQVITILILSILPLCAQGDNRDLYLKLDEALAHREEYTESREKKLEEIKLGARYVTDTEGKLRLYESLANGYHAFIYDSARVYAQKGITLAKQADQSAYYNRFQILRAKLLISRGFYAEAKEILAHLNISPSDKELISSYDETSYTLYNNWEAYSESNEFSTHYKQLKLAYISKAIQNYPKRDALYFFLKGEQGHFSGAPSQKTLSYYKKVLTLEKPSTRLYAMSAFSISEIYAKEGDKEHQEHYLILAAICDIKSATKENVALQDVALFMYQNKSD